MMYREVQMLYFNNNSIKFNPKHLLIAGYTAKDQKALWDHIEELKEIGVAAPNQIPMVYDLSPELLTTNDPITVVKNDSSGEAEFVLFHIDNEWYIGLGSDHTDRKLEAVSVHKSKQVCLKPVSSQIWKLADVEKDWDHLEIKSWTTVDGEEIVYQTGKLADFLSPQELLDILKERGYPTEDAAIFCGTPPLKTDGFMYGSNFRAELVNTNTNEKITLNYHVDILIDSKEDE